MQCWDTLEPKEFQDSKKLRIKFQTECYHCTPKSVPDTKQNRAWLDSRQSQLLHPFQKDLSENDTPHCSLPLLYTLQIPPSILVPRSSTNRSATGWRAPQR